MSDRDTVPKRCMYNSCVLSLSLINRPQPSHHYRDRVREREREISFSTIQSNILPSMVYLPTDIFTVSPAFFSFFT